jgi:amino acid transporter
METVDKRRQDGTSEPDAGEMDDVSDRQELRNRYYGLLQELRVVLPGIQVLLAFLLTVPFANRFSSLDALGRDVFAVALLTSLLSVVCLLTPIAYHRLGERTERSARLMWSIRLTRIGLGLLAVAMVTAFFCVTRFIYGSGKAWWLTTVVFVAIVGFWVLLPSSTSRHPDDDPT